MPPVFLLHLMNTGLGPFYDGLAHLFVTPEDLLPILALALLMSMLLGSLVQRRMIRKIEWAAAAVLGWCSPQSSVPRQTVGHHARAAKYEMGLPAACEGRRGEVPGLCLDIPPTGAFDLPSHIPTDQCAGARTGQRAEGRISQSRKTHLYGFR